jgi:hypothetical protein
LLHIRQTRGVLEVGEIIDIGVANFEASSPGEKTGFGITILAALPLFKKPCQREGRAACSFGVDGTRRILGSKISQAHRVAKQAITTQSAGTRRDRRAVVWIVSAFETSAAETSTLVSAATGAISTM